MFDSLPASLLTIYSGSVLAGLASCLIGSSIYDFKEAKLWQSYAIAKNNKQRPLISVVIYANSPRQALDKTLSSIIHNSYRNYEIIVIDDSQNPKSEIKDYVHTFRARYPKKTIKILSRRKSTNKSQAVRAGTRKCATGQIVLSIDAGMVLHKQALRDACGHFNSQPIQVLVPNIQIIPTSTLLGLFTQYQQLWRTSAKKLQSISGNNARQTHNGIFYRRGRVAKSESPLLWKYGNDTLLYAPPANSWLPHGHQFSLKQTASLTAMPASINWHGRYGSRLAKTVRQLIQALYGLLAMSSPIVITYLIYLALYFKQTALYALSWAIFTFATVAVVLSKSQINPSKKMQLTLVSPAMYSLFYLNSLAKLSMLVITMPIRFTRNLYGKALN